MVGRRTGGQTDRRTGGQAGRRADGQADRRAELVAYDEWKGGGARREGWTAGCGVRGGWGPALIHREADPAAASPGFIGVCEHEP